MPVIIPDEILKEAGLSEREALIERGRQLLRKSRDRNREVPARVIEREVQAAVDEVRSRQQQ